METRRKTETARKILVVDDDAMVRHALRRVFEGAAYEVIVAEDGLTGLQAALSERPDLVILDVTMPGLDGRDVLTRLKAHPQTAAIPTVFLSARDGHLSRINGLQIGAEEYFEKPFDLDMLRRRVDRILAKAHGTVH